MRANAGISFIPLRWGATIAATGVLALALALVAPAPPSAAGATAAGPASAAAASATTYSGKATASKKCKKKKGKKGKKCKKKKKPAPVVPPPTERARLTWNTIADLDLVIWDEYGAGGNPHWLPPGGARIPESTYSGDDQDGYGPEIFSDLRSPSTRQFTYGVCTAEPAGKATTFTLTVRFGSGFVKTYTNSDFGAGPFYYKGDWATVRDVTSYNPGGSWCNPL